ncbi:MAG: class I SAM-dependent methyltransferase [Chloroflexota bacterium]
MAMLDEPAVAASHSTEPPRGGALAAPRNLMGAATSGDVACRACGAEGLAEPRPVDRLNGVTSDCKPWPTASRIVVCRRCGLVQKPGSAEWLATIRQVYDAYAIYHQSASGAEQAVFDASTGQGTPRSVRLFERLARECQLPEKGRLLDIGCGNGVLLRSVSALAPGWTLAGADLDDRHRATVERIPGVERFYAGPAERIQDRFDLIAMQHVLEHVPEPVQLLRHLGSLLLPGGRLFVQVPNADENPFDLMVVDHASHFGPETVRATVLSAGLEVELVATDWAPKELTVVARRVEIGTTRHDRARVTVETDLAVRQTGERLGWLVATAQHAASASGDGSAPFGLLGTSIAATWLAAMLGDRVKFFVDEDASRIGQPFHGRPVIHPSAVLDTDSVYVAFPFAQARQIAGRLEQRYPGVRWVVPPV